METQPAGPPLLQPHRFSTDGIAAWERHDAWRSRPSSLGLLHETIPDEPFATASTGYAIGTAMVFEAQISAQTWRRTEAMARKDGVDSLAINIRTAGGATGEAGSRSFCAAGDSVVLDDLSEPLVHVSEASRSTLLILPRADAERILGPVRALHGLAIDGPGAALLRETMQSFMTAASHLPVAEGERMVRVIADLVAVALAMSGRSILVPAEALDMAVRRRAERIIVAELGSARLGVVRLSHALGVSRSTLYRLFRAEGGVSAHIRTLRLAHVRTLLGGAGNEPIAQLAERWGFCDAAHFGRLFREAYRMSPGEYRAAHRAPGGALDRFE